MGYFRDAEEVYAFIGRLFEDLIEDRELARRFASADTILQQRFREPDAEITVALLAGRSGEVHTGSTTLEPEVVLSMDADVAHRFWLGELNLTVALARGQMKASGPVVKILKLLPLTKPVFPRYRALLRGAGREDLLQI